MTALNGGAIGEMRDEDNYVGRQKMKTMSIISILIVSAIAVALAVAFMAFINIDGKYSNIVEENIRYNISNSYTSFSVKDVAPFYWSKVCVYDVYAADQFIESNYHQFTRDYYQSDDVWSVFFVVKSGHIEPVSISRNVVQFGSLSGECYCDDASIVISDGLSSPFASFRGTYCDK